jgi:RES domain-containing protein
MLAWRLCKAQRASTAFDGEGARRYGGRWNHAGAAAVYASATISLAVLEYLVHVDPDLLPERLVVIPVDIPGRLVVKASDLGDLPVGWRHNPAGDTVKEFGSAFLRRGKALALEVPSAVVPSESNFVINPRHPRFAEITIGAAEPFSLDPRLR